MAVSLVFHDGEQFHRARQVAANELQVAAQFAEVDFGPGRPLEAPGRKVIESKITNHKSLHRESSGTSPMWRFRHARFMTGGHKPGILSTPEIAANDANFTDIGISLRYRRVQFRRQRSTSAIRWPVDINFHPRRAGNLVPPDVAIKFTVRCGRAPG